MKSNLHKPQFLDFFKVAEIYAIAVCIIYTLVQILLWKGYSEPWLVLSFNLGIILYVVALAVLGSKYSANRQWVRMLRIILLGVATYMVYINTQNHLRVVNPHIYDQILISWDRAIFGNDLSKFFDGYRFPALTEFLQLCYLSFYFLPVIHGVILYRNNKHEELYELYNQIIFGFLLSYLLYFVMPAIGPRFTLYDFKTLELDMPGLWLTDYARAFINAGGGAPPGVPNPAELVNRDCMPSGHTMLTLINMLLVIKFRTKNSWFFHIIGTGLIISTVYLRYHYGVDVLAGIAFAFISILIEPRLRKYLIDRKIATKTI